MSKVKRTFSILLAAIMLLSVFIVMPTGAAAKKANPLEVESDPCKVDTGRLKNSDATFEPIRIYNGLDISVGYVLSGAIPEQLAGKLSLNKTTGELTLKKGSYKIGTYKIKVVVKAAGNQTYEAASIPVTVTIIIKYPNPITVKNTACTVDTNSLKKAAVTVKPLSISKAQGKVSVDFIMSGVIPELAGKLTLNKTTGAITLKKGSYKTGSYLIALTVEAEGNQSYATGHARADVTLNIKNLNPITVTAGARKIQQSALKTSAVTIRPLTIAKAQGKVTVTKVKSGTTASIYNYITVDKTNGKITIRKGAYKKGTYKIKLNIAAAGNKDYKGKILTRTVKVIIY